MKSNIKVIVLRWLMVIPVLMLLIFGSVASVQAATFANTGVVSSGQTIDDDLFMSAQNVQMDGTVNGLLMASGQTVTITGTVNGDAFLAGQKVIVSETAKINGNLFTGASSIQVYGKVGGSVLAGSASMDFGPASNVASNIYYGGYSLSLQPGSSVVRSLYSATYQTILKGTVERAVNTSGAALEINGKVGGDVYADLGDVKTGPQNQPIMPFTFMFPGMPALPTAITPGLHIGPDAQINGKLTYVASSPAPRLDQSAVTGGVVYITPTPQPTRIIQPKIEPQKPQTPKWVGGGVEFIAATVKWITSLLSNFITLLILGGLVIWLLPSQLQKATAEIKTKPGPAAGWGIVTILGGFIAMAVALGAILFIGLIVTVITLGGLGKAFFGIGFSSLTLTFSIFMLLLSYVSKIIVAFMVGDLLMENIGPHAGGRRIWSLLIGLILYMILWAIPCLGWLISALASIFGMGAIFLLVRSWRSPAVTEIRETPAG